MKKFYELFVATCFVAALTLPIVSPAQWGTAISFPGEARDGAAAFSIGGKGYISCGILSHDSYEFNPTTGAFTKKADIANGKANSFAACFVAQDKAYLVGGDSAFGASMNTVWSYDPASDTWTEKSPYPGGARVGFVTWAVGNRIFVGGGTSAFGGSGFGTIYDDLYEYMPASDTWVKIGALPIKAAFASCFVLGDYCYMTLGASSTNSYSTELWQYNPATMEWKKMKAFPGTARCAGIGFALNGKGYAGLGQSMLSTNYRDVYEYNPATDQWTKLEQYPDVFSAWSACFVLGDKAYVGTGIELSSFDFGASLYSFTPPTTTEVRLSEATNNTLLLSPNPASEQVRLLLPPNAQPARIAAYNAIGDCVFMSELSGASPSVELSSLPQGFYSLLVQTVEGKSYRSNLHIIR